MTPKLKQALEDVRNCLKEAHEDKREQHIVREGPRSYLTDCKGSNCELCEVERLLLKKHGYT